MLRPSDSLSQVDKEATAGAKIRPTALVLALTEIFPFHPQTIKLRLRLLKARSENMEIESQFGSKKKEFLAFVRFERVCEVDAELGGAERSEAGVDCGDASEDERDLPSAGGANREVQSVGEGMGCQLV